MLKMMLATIEDASELLRVQKESFEIYRDKYGDFDSNPYNMDLHRMEFNVKYRFGQYYKLMIEEKIIGGLFAFELDDPKVLKIAQFYFLEKYQHLGYGKLALSSLFEKNPDVKMWYVDTILQEEYNVEFYKHMGFVIIDEEEEHEGLSFVTLLKKNS